MAENSNTKKVKLALVGSRGKMGQALLGLIAKDDSFSLDPSQPDVVIDFSSPEGTKKAIQMGRPLVCGTTGLSEEIFEQLEDLATKVPVMYSPNFSLGMNLLFEVVEQLGSRLKKYAQVQIEETHHLEKKDTPSGSSIQLAKLLGISPKKILSKREEGVVGEHQVKFLFANEALTFQHQAFHRDAFAHGALLAAKFLLNKSPRLYSLDEIFD